MLKISKDVEQILADKGVELNAEETSQLQNLIFQGNEFTDEQMEQVIGGANKNSNVTKALVVLGGVGVTLLSVGACYKLYEHLTFEEKFYPPPVAIPPESPFPPALKKPNAGKKPKKSVRFNETPYEVEFKKDSPPFQFS